MRCINNLWSDFQEWKEDFVEHFDEDYGRLWKYYTQERAIFKGLPFATISAMACALLFNCAKPSSGAFFGAVNYIALTSLIETIRAHHHIDKTKAVVILGISCAISLAFIRTVCKTAMSYQTAALLATASFAGQIAREFLSSEDD